MLRPSVAHLELTIQPGQSRLAVIGIISALEHSVALILPIGGRLPDTAIQPDWVPSRRTQASPTHVLTVESGGGTGFGPVLLRAQFRRDCPDHPAPPGLPPSINRHTEQSFRSTTRRRCRRSPPTRLRATHRAFIQGGNGHAEPVKNTAPCGPSTEHLNSVQTAAGESWTASVIKSPS